MVVTIPPHSKSSQIGDLLTINLRRSISQSFVKGFAQNVNVPVFTKNQWDNQPIIARAHLSISALVTEKGAILPARNVGRMPRIASRFLVKVGSFVPNVASGNNLALPDRLRCLAHHHPIHDDLIAGHKFLQRKLMFCRNVGYDTVSLFP